MVIQTLRRLFTVSEYHQMMDSGILREDDRVELIEGEVIEMSPIGSRHAACVKRLNRWLSERVGQRAIVGVQDPIRLGERSEPQPDLALLRPRPDFYGQAHPEPQDVFLVVEVAETSADYDREVKVPLYARAGLVEVWLVDIAARVIEVYRQPGPTGYRQMQRLSPGQQLSSAVWPDVSLPVDEILG